MVNKIWKALFVKEPTHHEVAVLAKKEKLTIDEFVQLLLKEHKSNGKKI